MFVATCPFCNVINRFFENKRYCPHFAGFASYAQTAVCFCEENKMKMVSIEEVENA